MVDSGHRTGSDKRGRKICVKKDKCTAILLAAGKGTRIGGKIPKQFMNILDKPVLYYSLECFQNSPLIDEVILVTAVDMISYCRKHFSEKCGFTKVKHMIAGGAERYDSVYEGLKLCQDADYVFIHDGARPFLTEEILWRGYEKVKSTGACVAAVPSKDTIKLTDHGDRVRETPNRDDVWIVQTPQVFLYDLIRSAYDRLQDQDKSKITDDAAVLEKMGNHPVFVYEGSYKNIKITTAEDLETAELFVRNVKKC